MSTVSRITTNKYMSTPHGIYEMKFFFPTGIGKEEGNELSTNVVMDLIAEIVKNEDKKRPLTDDEIVLVLREKHNIKIARRTIAKYRDELRIPSSRGPQGRVAPPHTSPGASAFFPHDLNLSSCRFLYKIDVENVPLPAGRSRSCPERERQQIQALRRPISLQDGAHTNPGARPSRRRKPLKVAANLPITYTSA